MDKEEIIKHLRIGSPLDWITAETGLTRQTLWTYAKAEGIPPRRATEQRICPTCDKEFKAQHKSLKIFCKQSCYINGQLGNTASQYHKGDPVHGLTIRQWQRRSRAILTLAGHDFKRGQVVHHLDHDITNLDIANLFIFHNNALHLAFHHKQRKGFKGKPRQIIDGFYLA
jgi:hypothetical protein